MTIRQVLEAKGRDVATTDVTANVGAAATILAQRRIGALVVVDEAGRVAGILSERDIVRLVVAEGASGLDQPISAKMTRDVVTGSEAMTVDEAMALMTKGRFRHLPILEGEQLVGIISIGDAVKHRLGQMEEEAENLRTYIHAG